MMLDPFASEKEETMPILSGVTLKEIPLAMLAPYASQVMRNHGRTLKGMAQHRGMTSSETVAVIEGRSIVSATEAQLLKDEKKLQDHIVRWLAYPERLLNGCIIRADEPSILGQDKSSTLFEAIKHGDEDHQAWLKAAIAAHFAGDPMPSYIEARKKEYIVRYPGEPYFVLLGRDPQAPDLVNAWAGRRNHCEPGDYKVDGARAIATEMRQFKCANPTLGMPKSLYKDSLVSYNPTPATTMVLLGWRLDWPREISKVGMDRWCGADDWERKDRKVEAGAEAIPLYGRIEHSPSRGPSPWPTIKALITKED